MKAINVFRLFSDTKNIEQEEAILYIEMASSGVSKDFFKEDYEQALGLLACHMAIISNRDGGAVGAVSSVKEGDLSISYSGAVAGGDDYDQTSAGTSLKRLIQKHSIREIVT